jgi:hypothetical protein
VTIGYRTGLFVAVVIVAIIMMCLLTNITGPKRTAPASVKKKKDKKTVILPSLQTSASTKLNERINYYFFFALSFSKVNAIIDNVAKTGLS